MRRARRFPKTISGCRLKNSNGAASRVPCVGPVRWLVSAYNIGRMEQVTTTGGKIKTADNISAVHQQRVSIKTDWGFRLPPVSATIGSIVPMHAVPTIGTIPTIAITISIGAGIIHIAAAATVGLIVWVHLVSAMTA